MKAKYALLAALCGGLFATPLLGQPVITKQPTNQTVSIGATVRFRVSVDSPGADWTVQWWFKDAPLDAGVNPSVNSTQLSLTNVTMAAAGEYWAVGTADGVSVASDKATLDVDPAFTKITVGPIVNDNISVWNAAWGDIDGDGRLDLGVFGDYWSSGAHTRFYHNEGDGVFSTITTPPLGGISDRASYSVWADFENDGDLDLFVTAWEQQNAFTLVNQGKGDFIRRNVDANWTLNKVLVRGSVISWGDYDNDGFLDAAVTVASGSGSGNPNARNLLVHNEGNGQFSARTGLPWVAGEGNETSAWVDYDGDGDLDFFAARAVGTTPSQLFRNDGHGTFVEATPAALAAGSSFALCGAWADFDNDGDLDLLLRGNTLFTSAAVSRLLVNQGNGEFADWNGQPDFLSELNSGGAAWGDYDNDGNLDVFIGQYPGTGPDQNRNRLFRNLGTGDFEEVLRGSLVTDPCGNSIAPIWVDYDGDGDLDLHVVRVGSNGAGTRSYLYRNNGSANHWLKIRLKGTVSNSYGVGARIFVSATVRSQSVRQLRTISSQSVHQELEAHFGLGDATKAELIRIEWPSGNVQELTDYDANNLYTFTEPNRIQPLRPSASPGGAVVLTALGGSACQWRFNGVDLPGETQRTLSLTNITAAVAGRYSAVVTYVNGTTVTNYTYLTVDPTFTKVTQSPVVEGTESGWGCSWADYDDDGDLDLLVGNGGESTLPESLGFYRNDGAAGFARVTNEAGSLPGTLGRYSYGVWGDFTNDGALDCAVGDWHARNSALLFHRGLGTGRFERVAAASLPTPVAGVLSWVDYDNDGWLDLFNGCAYTVLGGTTPTNQLFRGTGDGEFAAVTQGSLAGDRYMGVEGLCWGDYDGDGDLDVLVTDLQAWWVKGAYPNCFYRNDGAGGFTRITDGEIARDKASSLVPAWADYDNDGRLDLFLSCYSDTSRLFHNEGGGVFTKRLMGPALETTQPTWGDFDNDGDLDLYVSRGQGTATTNLFYLNNGDGSFTSVTTGSPAQDVARSASCLWGDYDGDGFLDLMVVNNKGGSDCLYHNNGNANGWLVVRLKGTVSNRSAIGAKVRVQARIAGKTFWQMREVPGGNRCQGDLRQHFGLGDATKALTVRIEWPSGIVQELNNVTAKQTLTVTEPTELVALGEGRIWVQCWKGMKYEVEVSNDLTAWNSLGVFTNETGRLEVTDAGAAGQPYRFYRAIER